MHSLHSYQHHICFTLLSNSNLKVFEHIVYNISVVHQQKPRILSCKYNVIFLMEIFVFIPNHCLILGRYLNLDLFNMYIYIYAIYKETEKREK